MSVTDINGNSVDVFQGVPLDWISLVPKNINCVVVGYWYAEYHSSAYWVMPDDAVVTCTLKYGITLFGYCENITGAGIVPNVNGLPMLELLAGVKCVIDASSYML